MLSYALAIAIAISSLVLFSTAFLMSKIHRKDDFLWSGVGLFYALILWYCARNITGAVLLGQAAATVLVVAFSWQTIKLRQAIANPAQASETSGTNDFSVVRSINSLLKRRKPQVQVSTKPVTKAPAPKVTEQNIAIPETPAEISEQTERETPAAQDTAQDNSVQDTNVADAKPLVEIIDKTTLDISDVQNNSGDRQNQATEPVETESSPLPNKLPEVAQVDETKSTTKSTDKEVATKEDAASEPTQENIQPELETEDLSPEISNEVQDETPAPEVEPTSETVPLETAKDAKPKSSLDSLETVEVAEVLEAESARQSNNRETDRFNIIEVTTTEVNVTKEVIKLDDRNQDSDADFKDTKS
jgi:hypothetical protein